MIALTEQEKRILAIAAPVAGQVGMDIVRLRIMGGKRPTLQIMAEKEGGAPTSVEDCARFSRALSPVMELEDPISEAYALEVSTPGIDRPLTRPGDFARWVGHLVKVELQRPLDGQRRFTGVIREETEDGARIELNEEAELVVGVHELSKAVLVLTDELIEATRADGTAPPQPDEDDLQGMEIEEELEDENGELS